LEEVDFIEEAVVYTGALERFAARLPHLKKFNHFSVREEVDENW